MSAEIEIVPAGKARDLGLDRSMVADMDMMIEFVHILY